VDIDLAPLESFDLDGGKLDGLEFDGDNIEVDEVFDASQPTQQRNMSFNYTDLKGLCLIKAWENVSVDAVRQDLEIGHAVAVRSNSINIIGHSLRRILNRNNHAYCESDGCDVKYSVLLYHICAHCTWPTT
jgi:hypothetical protein